MDTLIVHVASKRSYAPVIGSISDASLFFTLPTRALTGQQIMSSPE
jgi:hypothetical protein